MQSSGGAEEACPSVQRREAERAVAQDLSAGGAGEMSRGGQAGSGEWGAYVGTCSGRTEKDLRAWGGLCRVSQGCVEMKPLENLHPSSSMI